MEKEECLLRVRAEKVTEQVSRLLENWEPYLCAKERLLQLLDAAGPDEDADGRQGLLSSYEVAVLLAAYFSGFQDGCSETRQLESQQFVQEVLNRLRPLT